jgi:hypothetical protein
VQGADLVGLPVLVLVLIRVVVATAGRRRRVPVIPEARVSPAEQADLHALRPRLHYHHPLRRRRWRPDLRARTAASELSAPGGDTPSA